MLCKNCHLYSGDQSICDRCQAKQIKYCIDCNQVSSNKITCPTCYDKRNQCRTTKCANLRGVDRHGNMGRFCDSCHKDYVKNNPKSHYAFKLTMEKTKNNIIRLYRDNFQWHVIESWGDKYTHAEFDSYDEALLEFVKHTRV